MGVFMSGSSASSNSHSNVPVHQHSLQDNFNAGFSSMKKGFSSLMSSIESTVKSPEDASSDTISVRSDLSSDSDNFVILNHDGVDKGAPGVGSAMDSLFTVEAKMVSNASIEVASEVFEEATPSDVSDITCSFKRKDSVSLFFFFSLSFLYNIIV